MGELKDNWRLNRGIEEGLAHKHSHKVWDDGVLNTLEELTWIQLSIQMVQQKKGIQYTEQKTEF